MADLTIKGNFFNNNIGAVDVSIYYKGTLVTDNPPTTTVSPNPDVENNDFTNAIVLPTGVYRVDVAGNTDGDFVLAITGVGILLDHPCPAKYVGSINDTYQLTVT